MMSSVCVCGGGSRCEPFAPSRGGGEGKTPGPAEEPLEAVLRAADRAEPATQQGRVLSRKSLKRL